MKSLSRAQILALANFHTAVSSYDDEEEEEEEDSGDGVYNDDDVDEGLGIGWLRTITKASCFTTIYRNLQQTSIQEEHFTIANYCPILEFIIGG